MPTKTERLPTFLKAYSDSSFTNPHEVVRPDEPPACTGNFTHMGAKYWGFETVRHTATQINADEQSFSYTPGAHQWFDIGFTHSAVVTSISISTKWFTGNQVPEISIVLRDRHSGAETMVFDHLSLAPDAEQTLDIPPTVATDCHVRCYHEGGIARINLFGEIGSALYAHPNVLLDAAISNTTNEHYGKPADAVRGNREVDHMVGWESARTGFGESTIFSLPRLVRIDRIIVDTYLHRLNPPLSCHIFGAHLEAGGLSDALATLPRWKLVYDNQAQVIPDDFQAFMQNKEYLKETDQAFEIKLHIPDASPWQPLIGFAPLRGDCWHEFEKMDSDTPVNVIFYMHYPNGGIHGLRVFGTDIISLPGSGH